MSDRSTELSRTIPESHRQAIRALVERVHNGTHSTKSRRCFSAEEAEQAVQDINKLIETTNSALREPAWSDAYTVLVTIRDTVQNFSAAMSMRRASLSQYDTVWPGSRWKGM